MSSRIIKVSSRQNHSITSNKNLVDFDIPSGLYDLSQSYLNLNVSIPSSSQDNITLLNLDRKNGAGANTGLQHDNTAFVRHTSLRSLTNGVIENNRHINMLKANQVLYEQSVSKAKSSEIMSKFCSGKDRNDLGSSNYRSVEKSGTSASKDKDHNHIIRLKEVLNFCKNSYYDTSDKGDLQLHLELDVENVVVQQHLRNDDSYWTTSYEAGANPKNGELADNTGGAGAVNPINTKRAFFNLDESPYYVSQGLEITTDINLVATSILANDVCVIKTVGTTNFTLIGSPDNTVGTRFTATGPGTGTGTVDTIETKQIVGIEENNDGTLALTLDSELTFKANSTGVLAKSISETLANITPTFNFCELVLKQLDPSQKQASQTYEYSTYHTQEDTVATSSLVKNYMINPMCKNVFVCSPADSTVLLSNTRVDSYRFSIDNNYQQNRKVEFGVERDPLHLSQVMKTYDNRDEQLKNTRGFAYINDQTEAEPFRNNLYTYMLMSPTPITGQNKLLGIEMNTGANLGRVVIFEEVIKQL